MRCLKNVTRWVNILIPTKNKNYGFYFINSAGQVDLSHYHQQAESKDRITSSKMVTNWVRVGEELESSVGEVSSRVNIVLDTVQEEIRNLANISAEISKLESEDSELEVGMKY